MSKINDFIDEAGMYFLATEDGDQPKLRPLSSHFEMDGKEIFGVGSFKDVYKQLTKNPKVEIVSFNPKQGAKWLRYTGTVVFEEDPKYFEYYLDKNPIFKKSYNDETGRKMAMFHLEDASAIIMGPDGSVVEKIF